MSVSFSPSVRAKFVVRSITRDQSFSSHPAKEVHTIHLFPVYSQDPASENRKFWEATPTGEVKLGVVNPAAGSFFELGAEYYLDFTKVEVAEVNDGR